MMTKASPLILVFLLAASESSAKPTLFGKEHVHIKIHLIPPHMDESHVYHHHDSSSGHGGLKGLIGGILGGHSGGHSSFGHGSSGGYDHNSQPIDNNFHGSFDAHGSSGGYDHNSQPIDNSIHGSSAHGDFGHNTIGHGNDFNLQGGHAQNSFDHGSSAHGDFGASHSSASAHDHGSSGYGNNAQPIGHSGFSGPSGFDANISGGGWKVSNIGHSENTYQGVDSYSVGHPSGGGFDGSSAHASAASHSGYPY